MFYFRLLTLLFIGSFAYAQQIIEQPALFEGCNDPLISKEQRIDCSAQKLKAYVERKLDYPDSALLKRVEGLAVARVNIDEKGAVTMVELLHGFDRDCNKEALRLLRALPAFSPALAAGQPVSSQITIPIRFELKNLLQHKNEDLYQLHWATQQQDSLSKKTLKKLITQEMPFVRDAFGFNHALEGLELTYIKGRKLKTAYLLDAPEQWSSEMLKILKQAKAGSILVFTASIKDKFKTVEVIREFYLN